MNILFLDLGFISSSQAYQFANYLRKKFIEVPRDFAEVYPIIVNDAL